MLHPTRVREYGVTRQNEYTRIWVKVQYEPYKIFLDLVESISIERVTKYSLINLPISWMRLIRVLVIDSNEPSENLMILTVQIF